MKYSKNKTGIELAKIARESIKKGRDVRSVELDVYFDLTDQNCSHEMADVYARKIVKAAIDILNASKN